VASGAGVAEIYASLGEIDAAFECADKAVDQRDPMILAIQISPSSIGSALTSVTR
jgi:hypothetical protein